jgi:hypothetical protein
VVASGREEYRTASGFEVNSYSNPDAVRSMFCGKPMARESMIPPALATTRSFFGGYTRSNVKLHAEQGLE